MEVEQQKVDSISDITTTPWYIYVWKAPIWSAKDSPVWQITKTSLSSPFEKRFWKSNNPTIPIIDRIKNKWDDRENLIY